MPTGTEIIAFFEQYYTDYGYPLVLLFSILETIFGISWQLPGTFIVILATFYARQGTLYLPYVLVLAMIGWFIGDNINYFLGKYGWYRFFFWLGMKEGLKKGEGWMKKHGNIALFLGHAIPAFATFVSTAAGVLGMNYKRYLIFISLSIVFWVMVWGPVGYLLGDYRREVEIVVGFFAWPTALIILGWFIYKIVKIFSQGIRKMSFKDWAFVVVGGLIIAWTAWNILH